MHRKVLFGVDYTNSELIKLILYLFVGGTAALVEWALFYIFINYLLNGLGLGMTTLTMLATALAFGLPRSTITFWVMREYSTAELLSAWDGAKLSFCS